MSDVDRGGDLKSEVGERRSPGIPHPQFNHCLHCLQKQKS